MEYKKTRVLRHWPPAAVGVPYPDRLIRVEASPAQPCKLNSHPQVVQMAAHSVAWAHIQSALSFRLVAEARPINPLSTGYFCHPSCSLLCEYMSFLGLCPRSN